VLESSLLKRQGAPNFYIFVSVIAITRQTIGPLAITWQTIGPLVITWQTIGPYNPSSPSAS